jgi:hypothetical protein
MRSLMMQNRFSLVTEQETNFGKWTEVIGKWLVSTLAAIPPVKSELVSILEGGTSEGTLKI